ncbi:MAG: hypothetical protein RL701_3022 [Pseudomonadota bacterium]
MAQVQTLVTSSKHDYTAVARAEARGRPPLFWAVAVALMSLHFMLVNLFCPVRRVFVDSPISGIDYDLHIGQVFRVVEALDRWGRAWSYDPQLLAGQPEGTITDSGSKGWELYTFALHTLGVPTAIAYNTFILLVMGSCPLLVYAAARNFGLTRSHSVLAACMAAMLWFFDSYLHWVWFVGMISWCGGTALALLCLAIFQRWVRQPTPRFAWLSGGLLGLCLLIHPYTFFILAPPMAAVYVRDFRALRWREHASVLAMVGFAISVNAYWLHNALKHWHYILDSAVYAQAAPEYAIFDFLGLLYNNSDTGMIGVRSGFRLLFLGLAVAQLLRWSEQRDVRWLPFVSSIVPLYAISYLACYIPGMQQTQPYRQVIPAMLLTTLPAAQFTLDVLHSVKQSRLPRASLLALGILTALLAQHLFASQVLYFLPGIISDPVTRGAVAVSKYGYPRHPDFPSHVLFGVPHSDDIEFGTGKLLGWLETHIPRGARILVEGPVLGERLAWRGHHEVLGGFFERNVQHVDANYFRGHRGLPVDPREFEQYLRSYAVEYIVNEAHDVDEFAALDTLLTHVGTPYGRRVYRTRIAADRVLAGGGKVTARANTIDLRGSDPDQASLLSYHWHEALRCKPDCRVERALLAGDRVGFLRIPSPHPTDLTIYNSYETW